MLQFGFWVIWTHFLPYTWNQPCLLGNTVPFSCKWNWENTVWALIVVGLVPVDIARRYITHSYGYFPSIFRITRLLLNLFNLEQQWFLVLSEKMSESVEKTHNLSPIKTGDGKEEKDLTKLVERSKREWCPENKDEITLWGWRGNGVGYPEELNNTTWNCANLSLAKRKQFLQRNDRAEPRQSELISSWQMRN